MWPPAMPWAVLPTAAGASSSAKGSSASSLEPWQTRHQKFPALVFLLAELTESGPTACPLSPKQASLGHSVKTGVPTPLLCEVLHLGDEQKWPHANDPARGPRRVPQVLRGGSER